MSEGKMNPRGDVINDDTTEGSIPIKEDGKFVDSPLEINEEEDRIDSSKAMRLPTGSLEIGNQMKLDDATGTLIYSRNFDEQVRICLTLGFDDTGTIQKPFNTEFDPKLIRDVIQPDDTGEIIDTEIITEIPSTANQFVSKVYYKTGSSLPTANLRFRLYLDSILDKNLVVDQIVQECCAFPLSILTEFSFDLSPLVGLLIGQTFYAVFSSDDPFSMMADATNTTPWAAVDRQEGDGFRVLDERDIDDKFLGLYSSLTALESAHPTADPGQYGYVDQGVGQDVVAYIWDDDDSVYVLQLGESTAETPASIKSKYESNPDTNEFDDTEKSKLSDQSGINTGDQDLSGLQEKLSEGPFVDGDKTKLDNQSGANTGDQDLSGLVGEAPNDGNQYSRKSEAWSETTDTVTGWISGLDVAENSPKDTAVLYGAGTYKIEGISKAVTPAGAYNLANGYLSVNHYSGMVDDQHALVTLCVDADEVIKSIRGDIGEKGEVIFPPVQPFNSVCLAIVEIKVDGSDNPKDIDNKHITDERNKTSINTDETVSVSADDQSTGYLADKIMLTGNITGTIVPDGDGKEVLNLDVPSGSVALPSILYEGITHIDGMDVAGLYPAGILWVDSIADINLQSLQNGQDKQMIHVVNLSLKKVRFENNNGTFDSIIVEGNADLIADKYGGGTIIYNASKGNWYLTAIN